MKSILFTLYLFSGTYLLAQTSVKPDFSVLTSLTTISTSDIVKKEETDIKKITYQDHLYEAQSFDIPLIESNAHMDSLILANKLIAIPEEGEGYKIQKLTHSRAFLNEPTYLILKEIAASFYNETGKEISISSLTRTIESQSKLRRVNSNATKGDSSHNYGVSFDISYNRYSEKVGRNYAFERMMETILSKLEGDGKIYFIKERRQPCYHITLRNNNIVI